MAELLHDEVVPEESDGAVDVGGFALCCRFNRWGSLLAVGCNDGRVAIADFVTRGVARIIGAHVQPIASLSWSRSGRRLLSASTDTTVALWHVVSGALITRFRFPATVTKVQFHPRDRNRFLVCPTKSPTLLINAIDGSHRSLAADDDAGVDLNIVATFDRRGRYILTGNGRGRVAVFESVSLDCVASFRLQSSHPVRSIEASKKGDGARFRYFLANSGDRVIRVFDLREVLIRGKDKPAEPVQKLQDMVNKISWKTCCLSGDGEYVCAGSAKSHSLYIWERNNGSLVKILHGSKGEMLLDVQWHPARPLVCSVSNGVVSVWAQSHVENWSAFAPDFKELDENVEYEERESEFDLEDEDKSVDLDMEKPVEDEQVDVTEVKPSPYFCSSDEEGAEDGRCDDDAPLLFLPISPEVEQPEELPIAGMPPDAAVQLSPVESADARRHRAKTFDIDIGGAPGEASTMPFVAPTGRKRSQNCAPQSSSARHSSKNRRSYK